MAGNDVSVAAQNASASQARDRRRQAALSLFIFSILDQVDLKPESGSLYL